MVRPADSLAAATAGGGAVRAVACLVTGVVETARRRHGLYPVATAALGRALAGAALLSRTLKEGQRLTLRLLGDGPLGGVVVDADAEGHLRGYVKHPRVMLPVTPDGKLDVGRAVGRRGLIHVSRDLGLRTPYESSAPLVNGEVGEDLAHYLLASEQVPSAVAVGVRVGAAGRVLGAAGLLVQVLPGGEERMEAARHGVEGLGSISALAAQGAAPWDLIQAALAPLAPVLQETRPLSFRCTCTRARARRLLAGLGEDELGAMAREDHGAELRCHFCGRVYRFTEGEVLRLAHAAQQPPTGRR